MVTLVSAGSLGATVVTAPPAHASAPPSGPPVLYVADSAGTTVTPVTTDTNEPGVPITVGEDPEALAVSPDGEALYVANSHDGTVSRVPAVPALAPVPDGPLGATIDVGDDPVALALTPDGSTLYVANGEPGTVTPVDTASDVAGTPIDVGSDPAALAVTPDGRTLYVANRGNGTVSRINTSTNEVVGDPITVGSAPAALAVTPDGSTLYVANSGSGTVTPIDTATNGTRASINAWQEPVALAVTPDGATLYVADAFDNRVTAVPTGDGELVDVDVQVSRPAALAVTPDGATVYVASSGSGAVTPIATATNTAGGDITVGGEPAALVVTPDQAPTAAFDVSPARAGSPASFDGSASTAPFGMVASYRWDFGDASPAVTTTEPTTTHVYAHGGSFTASLTVTDSAGTSTERVFTGRSVSRNGGPSARATRTVDVPAAVAPGPWFTCTTSGSSDSPTGLAGASCDAPGGGGLAVRGFGTGTVTVARYSGDPIGRPGFSGASFFDVRVSPDSRFTSLTVDDCAPDAVAGGVQWWNPAAAGGSGAWQVVTPQSPVPVSPPCVRIVITPTSSPTLSELTGTVFANTPGGAGGAGGGAGGAGDAARVGAGVSRVGGRDRIATAIAASRHAYADGVAGAVVLARADGFADALAGVPLAAAKRAPLLLTGSDRLAPEVETEIGRAIAPGGTVYLLGGPAALSADVEGRLAGLGYRVARAGGADRAETAVAVAGLLGSPARVLLVDGRTFADGLVAGPAAAHVGGVVLETDGPSLPESTAAYLAAHPLGAVWAIGGVAAAAAPAAAPLVGADRYATAVQVAEAFFDRPATIGIADGSRFADALAAGAALAPSGGPLLLSAPGSLPAVAETYLRANRAGIGDVTVYGGPAAVDEGVLARLRAVLS